MTMQQEDISITAKALLVDALIVYVKGRANGDPAFRLAIQGIGIAPPSNSLRLTIQTLIKTNKELIYRSDLLRPLINIISAEIDKAVLAIRSRVRPEERSRIEQEASTIAKKQGPKPTKISEKNSRSFAWSLYLILVDEVKMLPHEAYYATVLVAQYIWNRAKFEEDDGFIDELSREIHFPPEHQQAGIGILSYFSTVLKQKLPGNDASISIRQEKEKVTLTIRYRDGTEEQISHLLQEYGLVVTGKISADQFLTDPIHATALKQKLELAEIEVRHTRELLALERSYGERRFSSLEAEVAFLKQQLAFQLSSASSERQMLLDKLVGETGRAASESQLHIIQQLVSGIIDKDESILKESAEKLNNDDPTLLEKIQIFLLTNSAGGVVGNTVYDWLKTVWPILPK